MCADIQSKKNNNNMDLYQFNAGLSYFSMNTCYVNNEKWHINNVKGAS